MRTIGARFSGRATSLDGVGRYTVVLKSASQLRLMDKTVGRPGFWLLNREAPDHTEVRVRDDVLEEDDIPWHRGVMFEVNCEAPTIDDATKAARGEAEATATLMAAAARAPVGPARPVLAVDVTPGIEDRSFLQWVYGGAIVVGKTVVTPQAFGAFHGSLLEAGSLGTTDQRLLDRALLSLSWYRLALGETDALTRFMHLWLAVEAMEPLLADHFGCDSQGFGGLRALAEAQQTNDPGAGSKRVRAPIVRRIFQLYAEGSLGTTAIARALDAEGAPAPRKHGWSPNALQLILANPAYRGLIRWKESLFEGVHEPLVDQELFEKAQQTLRHRREDASLRRGNPSHFLLSGLVRCDHCGRAYVGTSAHGRSSRYTYYACSTRYKYGPSKCNGERLPKDLLEAAVLAQLAEIYRDGRLIERALADASKHTAKERPRVEERLAATRTEIARVERKLERYFEAFEGGGLSAALCQERVDRHRARLETLREQEADLARTLATQEHTPPDATALAGLADQLDQILATESPERAKELLRLLIKEIRVHNRHRIVPTYRVPAAVRAIPSKVGGTGLEPVTPSLSSWCSPN